MKEKPTLVIGASENPARYSNRAVRLLRDYGHPVVAISNKSGYIDDVAISDDSHPDIPQLHTITLYIRPELQPLYLDNILKMKPARVIFNPGTENPGMYNLLETAGIEVWEACTLVLLNTGQY